MVSKTVIYALLLVALLAVPALAAETGMPDGQEPLAVDMFPLEDLQAGMMGVGYTVVRGTKIEQFNVEVLELIPDGGFDGGPLVLARYSGGPIEFSDGAGQGYSGSPVYINGKLLGAISTGMPFTDTHIGGITPIQSMVHALPYQEVPDYSENTVLPPSENNGKLLDDEGNVISYVDDWEAAREFNDEMRARGINRYAAVPCTTPILSSGLSQHVLSAYGDQLDALLGKRLELVRMPMGQARDYGLLQGTGTGLAANNTGGPGLLQQKKDTTLPLKPGDACTVSLMQGDLELYAIGTVTYTDDSGRILMFGHPFFQSGHTNMPIGKGYVTWTYESLMTPFKQGVRLNTVGTMTRDHAAACGGTFNEDPELLPIKVKIVDVDSGRKVTKRYEIIKHPDFTPMLLSIGTMQAATEVLDREPGGTMKLSYHIEGVGLKEPLRRTDYYYDDINVLQHAAMNVMPLGNLLVNNIYREVDITKAELMLEITRNRINASIDDAEIVWDKNETSGPDDAQQEMGSGGSEDSEAAEDADAPNKDEEEAGGDDSAQMAATLTGSGISSRTVLSALESVKQYWQRLAGPGMQRLQEGGEEEPPPVQDEEMGPYGAMMMGGMGDDMPTFRPGEEIKVNVRLQPYREDAVWRQFSVTVPDDFPAGSTMVVVHGGGDLVSMSELGGKGRSLFGMGPIIEVEDRDLDNILTQIIEWPTNNELLVTLVRPYDPTAAMELGGTDSEQPDDKVDAVYKMEHVIYNGFMLPVNIITDEMEAQQQAMEEAMAGETAAMENGNTEAGEDSGDDGDSTGKNLPFD